MIAKTFYLPAVLVLSFCVACEQPAVKNANDAPRSAATPAPEPSMPKDGNYNGTGKVTKVNTQLVSVEMDHEAIEGLMPAMRMEFYVTEKSMIDGLKIGDVVDFVVEYKQGTEKIVQLKKIN